MPKLPVAVAALPDSSRRRWTREQARAVLASYEASGLSLEKFAEREGLKPERIACWTRKLKTVARPPIAPKFIELRPAGSARGADRLELVLRSGHVLFVGESFNPASLRQILEILERDAGC